VSQHRGAVQPVIPVNNRKKNRRSFAHTQQSPERLSARAHFASFNFSNNLICAAASSASRRAPSRLTAKRRLNPQFESPVARQFGIRYWRRMVPILRSELRKHPSRNVVAVICRSGAGRREDGSRSEEQATDEVRSVPNGTNRVVSFSLKAVGPKLTPLFDGNEQLISITSIPSHVRSIYLPVQRHATPGHEVNRNYGDAALPIVCRERRPDGERAACAARWIGDGTRIGTAAGVVSLCGPLRASYAAARVSRLGRSFHL
jgi:hypothetical protein